MNKKKRALLSSVISLVLCFSMLLSTTYAWFTDSVTSTNNIIQSGNLDVELEYWDSDAKKWKDVKQETPLFEESTLWEPGHTQVVYLRVANEGTLALKYQLGINIVGESTGTNVKGDPFKLSDSIYMGVKENLNGETDAYATREDAVKAVEGKSGIISTGYSKSGDMAATADKKYLALVVYMPTTVENEANYKTGTEAPKITLGIKLVATQKDAELDSFGSGYDAGAELPKIEFLGGTATAAVTATAENKVASDVKLQDKQISGTVPAGALLEQGVTEVTLNVTLMEQTTSNVATGKDESMVSVDVHVAGLSKDNKEPVVVTMQGVLVTGLNVGNLDLYHVEQSGTNKMTQKFTAAEVKNHNDFYYDPATGDVTVAMATFSEVALVNEEPKWEGNADHSWYDASKTELTIANADQLWSFSQIVGGMDGQTQDSFAGKTVKLISDINIGDTVSDNGLVFYPIGYYNSDGTYEKTNKAITSGLRNFAGTFDGNGHTISNFYQNTWEMKGDHNWYSPEEQYYRDGMGLFGRVYGGTVKNLTVKNFSSDGEIATTGVIAAYAEGATFENIAIFNCNPRVYNIGNGGIVGCVGWYAKEEGLKTTFTNITVDNSNKISALWGSYDVACGGIVGQYYPTSGQSSANYPKNAGIHFENCHVSAQMDVYNDVCANYQYYAYRYTGMLIGSVRENETIDGHVYPKMEGITASGCTVHFGDWNDYYYCEIIDNTTASYTHDYQMSRLEQVASVDVENMKVTSLKGETTDISTSGRVNYVVVNGGHATENATCYHFKDGAVWTHDMGGIQTGIDENGDGQDDLKEDKQHIYLEFNNLVTGYGWGVTSKGVGDLDGVTILDREEGNSVTKFAKVDTAKNSYMRGTTVAIGELFKAAEINDKKLTIQSDKVQVFVSPVGDDSTAGGTYTASTTENWEEGTLFFNGAGKAIITITDYYFCTPTTIEVEITEPDFMYRVGNQNAITYAQLSKLLTSKTISTEFEVAKYVGDLTVEKTGTSVDFKKTTGIAEVTIDGKPYYVEVVDAVNATTATNATENNVVLLNDCGFSSLEVSDGYTLYGNGFTMTCGSDSAALDMGYAFVTLTNGTLDNVQIVCPNFDYAVLYKSNMTESGNRSETTDKTRYFNVKSGVMASGNSQILNSRISGARAAVNVSGGNVVIDNSRIELGAVASILVGAANSVTLRDVTLVQKPTASTYDSSKTLMGFSVLMICNSEGDAAPVTLDGTLTQNAWVDENDKQYVPSAGQSIVDTVLGKTEYLHDIDGDGTNESLNLGFAYMPESLTSAVNATTIADSRIDKETVPYDYAEVSILNGKTYVYSYKNTNGTADSFKTESDYVPNKYSDIITVAYSDTADGLTTGKSYGTDGWVYELNVDLDKLSGYALDFSKLSMSVNGVNVTDFKVNGSAKPTSPVAVAAGGTTYTLTATVNGKECTATYKVTGTETSKESPSLVASNYEAGLCVASSYGGTWHGAAPALEGIQIKYWSVAEKQYKTITLSDYTPTTAGKQNGTNTTWTYSPDNGDFTLTLTGGQVHSSNNVYAMPVVCDGKLYFVAASSNGLVNTGNSARTIPISYSFKDNNNGDELTFSHTWSVAENKDEQYKYSDFCNGTLTKLEESSGGGSCVMPDTLITLADGTQVRVDSLSGDEMLLVWNMETGKLDSAPIMFLDSDPEAAFEIIHLYFSDGTDVKVIYEHGFWDYDLNRYVYLDCYADKYIGHTFAKQSGEELTKVQLTDVVIETEVTTAWSPVTEGHLCYFVNGMLSMPGGVGGLFNIFEVDADTMTYDYEAMAADIEKYGLFTYEELNAIEPLSEEMFNAAGGAYLKISIGKGNLTMEELVYMINRYSKFFE